MNNDSRKISLVRVVAAVVPFLVLLGLLWFFYLRHPAEEARLFLSPISTIQSIRISSGGNLSLVENDIVITDSRTIQEIMAAIRSAKPYSPNHPADRWTCKLIVSNPSGESHVDVSDTAGQNTILYCPGGPLQSGTLGNILEKVVSKEPSPPGTTRKTVF